MTYPNGLNISPFAWWVDCPTLDVMRGSSPWAGRGLIGADGWPLGNTADEMLCQIPVAVTPTEYTLIVLSGAISSARSTTPAKQVSPGRWTFTASREPDKGGALHIDPVIGAPVKVAVVRSDLVALYDKGEMFTPEFLEDIDGAYCLRFMDWCRVNKPLPARWPEMGDASWVNGVPVPVMVALCNRVRANMMINTHHLLTRDQIAAMMVGTLKLDPGLKVYVDGSNEVWNFGFPQAGWANKQPGGVGGGYGTLLGNVANIVREINPAARMTPCWQFTNTWAVKGIYAAYDATGAPRDMISHWGIAPYVSPKKAQAAQVQALAVAGDKAGLLALLEANRIANSIWFGKWAAVTKASGTGLICYEHNLSLYPTTPEQMALFEHVAHSEEGAAMIDRNMADFFAAGGDWACYFNSAGIGGKNGYWGMRPYYGAPGFPTQRRWDRGNMLGWKSLVIS